MKKARQISAGGVVYKIIPDGSIRVALTYRKDHKVWCLPKGKLNPGESPQEAAEREILEETGLHGILEGKIDNIKYSFFWPREDTFYFKVVTFYLYKYSGGSAKRHDPEVDEVKWLDVDQALTVMKYKGEKDVVKKAQEMVLKTSGKD